MSTFGRSVSVTHLAVLTSKKVMHMLWFSAPKPLVLVVWREAKSMTTCRQSHIDLPHDCSPAKKSVFNLGRPSIESQHNMYPPNSW